MPITPEALYEQTIVVRSQIGDEAAFQELLKLYGPRLLLFTQRMMQSSPEQVADVTQEIWIAIYRALPGLLDASKFRPWGLVRPLPVRVCLKTRFGRQGCHPNPQASCGFTEHLCSVFRHGQRFPTQKTWWIPDPLLPPVEVPPLGR